MRPLLYVTSYKRSDGSHATGNAVDLKSIWSYDYSKTDKDIYLSVYLYLIERLKSGILLYNRPSAGNWHYHYYADGGPARGGIETTEYTGSEYVSVQEVEVYTPQELIKNLRHALLTVTWDQGGQGEAFKMPLTYTSLSGLPIIYDNKNLGFPASLLLNNLSEQPINSPQMGLIWPILAISGLMWAVSRFN